METPALLSTAECSQMRGQMDIWDAINASTTEPAAEVEPDAGGALFALRLTDRQDATSGALFAITL